jgi:hypothetical protein
MYTHSVDTDNILHIFKDGVEIASYGPWEEYDRANAWGEKRVAYLQENGEADEATE